MPAARKYAILSPKGVNVKSDYRIIEFSKLGDVFNEKLRMFEDWDLTLKASREDLDMVKRTRK